MAIAGETLTEAAVNRIPATMLAAVYRGQNDVRMETVPVPTIGAGELLVRVHTCGICGTDLKKIATGSHSAPRIFGHGQTERAIDRFWRTVLVSALNEEIDRISVPYAAQVMRESFLKSAAAGRMFALHHHDVPQWRGCRGLQVQPANWAYQSRFPCSITTFSRTTSR